MVENKKKIQFEQIAVNIYFIICCMFFVVPIMLVITSSFTSDVEIRLHGYSLLPREWSMVAFQTLFRVPQRIIQAYWVTAYTAIIGTVLSTVVMGLIAYSLSRRDFAYRKIITFYVFFTMLFSGGLIPSYMFNTQVLGLRNSVWILLLLPLCNAWFIIIMRTFFQQIPSEIIESAKIDGAGELRIFFTIITPLSKPVFATIALFCLLGRWNEWFIVLIYITESKLYTLQFLLQRILLEVDFVRNFVVNVPGIHHMINLRELPSLSLRYAMTVLAAGPMLLVFPFFQRYFTKGLTIGSVKG